MKVCDLSGALLDYWVLRAEGWVDDRLRDMQMTRNGEYCIAGAAPKHAVNGHCWRSPSTDWAVGGPLIERNGIQILFRISNGDWIAKCMLGEFDYSGSESMLTAAMRAFVRNRFGDEAPDV